MSSNLEQLMGQLESEPVGDEVDLSQLEGERGRRIAPPQPAENYVFRLPMNLADAWAPKPMDTKHGKRVYCLFDDEHPLTIVAGGSGQDLGRNARVLISNAERNRAKKGEPERLISTAHYLLKSLGFNGMLRNGDNRSFILLLTNYAGAAFGAALEYNARCDKKKVRWVEVEGKTVKAVVDGKELMGCGEQLWFDKWPREKDGSYQTRVRCKCGAVLDPFLELLRFRPAVA